MSENAPTSQSQCLEEIFQRIASDLSMIADRELAIESVETEVANERAVGEGKVHISFRLRFTDTDNRHEGCLLVPLPDAISLACYLMMVPQETVEANRLETNLDSVMKDAMLEVGSFVSGATESAVRALGLDKIRISFGGCQGVRADVRPVLEYVEGDPLLVGRARVTLSGFPADTMILMLPAAAVSPS